MRDETWKQMRLGLEPVKTLDSNLRLSRHAGDVQVVVYHKPSDPLSAGAAGSQAVAIAKDLLHLADIRVLHGQDKAVADELADLLGLNPVAQQLVTGWAMGGKGRAVTCSRPGCCAAPVSSPDSGWSLMSRRWVLCRRSRRGWGPPSGLGCAVTTTCGS